MTATGIAKRGYELDLRRRRADEFFAFVMHAIGDLIEDRREAHHRLIQLLEESGVEIITDHIREEAGLPPRGGTGWTREELAALELARMATLIRPLSIPPISLPVTKKHGATRLILESATPPSPR